MNAIIYIRVSTTEQAELGYSLKVQEDICRNYAKRNSYEILKVFIEKGESAKTTNRTELKKLLNYINVKSNEIDFLIVFKLDRLTRNLLDYANLINLLSKYGITLKSATESISETPEGKLMQNIIASFAQYDNDQRSQRTRSGMVQAVKEGRWVWKAPLGYKFITKEGKSYLIPSEERFIIEKIFTDFSHGIKQCEIINDLKLLGFTISKQTLNKILAKPVYIGKIKSVFFDVPISGLQEPIINETLFQNVQNILNRRTKSHYLKDTLEDFPLRHFLKCPVCNGKLTGSWSKGRSKKYPYYHCTKKGCKFKSLKKDKVELLFTTYLKLFEPSDTVINDFSKRVKEFLNNNQKQNDKILLNINKELSELEARKNRIEDLAIEGTFSKDRFISKISEVEKEILKKKTEFDNNKLEKINIDSLLNYFKFFVKNISRLWIESSLEQKRRLQDFIFPEGIFIENYELRTTSINPILSQIKNQKEAVINSLSSMVAHRGLEPLF